MAAPVSQLDSSGLFNKRSFKTSSPIRIFLFFHKAIRSELDALHRAAMAFATNPYSDIKPLLEWYHFNRSIYKHHCNAEDEISLAGTKSRYVIVMVHLLLAILKVNLKMALNSSSEDAPLEGWQLSYTVMIFTKSCLRMLKSSVYLMQARRALRARRVRMSMEGQAVQNMLNERRNKADLLKEAEEEWCDSRGTLQEVKAKIQMRQEGISSKLILGIKILIQKKVVDLSYTGPLWKVIFLVFMELNWRWAGLHSERIFL